MLELVGVTKQFKLGTNLVHALNGIDFSLNPGDTVSLVGESGSGKSTLLSVASLIDRPSTGQVKFQGIDVGKWDEVCRSRFRGEACGFIFQKFHLIESFSVIENVMLLARIQNQSKS